MPPSKCRSDASRVHERVLVESVRWTFSQSSHWAGPSHGSDVTPSVNHPIFSSAAMRVPCTPLGDLRRACWLRVYWGSRKPESAAFSQADKHLLATWRPVRRLLGGSRINFGRSEKDGCPHLGPTPGAHGNGCRGDGDVVRVVGDNVYIGVTEGEVERLDLSTKALDCLGAAATRAEPPSDLSPLIPSRV